MVEKTLNISDVVEVLSGVINIDASKPQSIPSPLIAIGARLKTGLSAREVTKNIIARKNEAGAKIGPLPDGSDSVEEKMILIMVQEILEHLVSSAKISVVVPPGTPVTATGIGADGIPVVVQGTTTGFAIGNAIIQ
jgi:hypothetical protein